MINHWGPEEIAELLLSEPLAHLAGVQNYLKLLDTSTLTGLQHEHVASATQHAANLRALLEGLAECARVDCGRFVSTDEETDLGEVLNSVVKPHVAPLAERGTELVVKIDAEIPANLMLDGPRLRLVLSNLLCAALNLAAPDRIIIEVGTKADRLTNAIFVITCSVCASYERDLHLEGAYSQPQRHPDPGAGFSMSQKLAKALGWGLTVRNEADRMAFLLELRVNKNEKSCVLP